MRNIQRQDCTSRWNTSLYKPEVRKAMMGETVEVNYFQRDVFSLGVTMLQLAKLAYPDNVYFVWNSEKELCEADERELSPLAYSSGYFFESA